MKTDGNLNSKYSEATELKPIPAYRQLLPYLRSKLKVVGLFLLCMSVFFSVCLLYQLENIPKLLYAFFLWAFAGLCCGIYDFTNYVKRSAALNTALMNIENMPDILPSPEDAIERQYRVIVDTLLDERRNLLSHANFKDTDMTDYYTMWAHQIKVPIAAMRLLLQNAESKGGEAADKTEKPVVGVPEPCAEIPASETEVPEAGTQIQVSAEVSGIGTKIPELYTSAVGYNRLLSEELFRIEQYVEMVLYYQRLDSINSDFLFKEYDLREIVNQAVKKHSMFFINSRLSLNMEEFTCKVVTDEKWLQFVIGQVLSNALKYTSRGSITIRLEKACGGAPAIPSEDSAAFVSLIIEDTGIGIRPEDLPRIFERGFTGYNGRLDKKSTGIGLYLSKKILQKLSHTIEVTSEAGKGTRVAIGFVLTKM